MGPLFAQVVFENISSSVVYETDAPGIIIAEWGVLRPGRRPRYEPRNMQFADGLDGWLLNGSFAEHASESHWHDYTCTTEHGIAVRRSDHDYDVSEDRHAP